MDTSPTTANQFGRDPGAVYSMLIRLGLGFGALAAVTFPFGFHWHDFPLWRNFPRLLLGEVAIVFVTGVCLAPLHFFRETSRTLNGIGFAVGILATQHNPLAPASPNAAIAVSAGPAVRSTAYSVTGIDQNGRRLVAALNGPSINVQWTNSDGRPTGQWGTEKVRKLDTVQFDETHGVLLLVTRSGRISITADDRDEGRRLADELHRMRP